MALGDNATISIQRLVSKNNKQDYQSVSTGIGCYIEPVDARRAPSWADPKQIFRLYSCMIQEEYDVRVDDLVTDDSSSEYTVVGITPLAKNTDVANHTEFFMLKK